MKNFWTACRETGDLIDCFSTYEDAINAIEKYEEEDRADNDYIEDFYDVVNDDHCSVDENGNEIK